MSGIRREDQVDSALVPPLDPSLFTPTKTEKEFLHAAISEDDEELHRRVIEVQQEAYAKYPYPCIHVFHHVSLMMSANPMYPTVLEAGKKGNTLLLDLGCCMGTDVRKLAYDGYPAANIIGCDLRQEFIELGWKLYRDQATCPIHFFPADIFELHMNAEARSASRNAASVPPQITELSQLLGSLTHVYAGALFHLFDEQTQNAIALRVALLLKRQPGAIVFGRHSGLEEEGMLDDHLGRVRYGHSERSWPLLWKQVFTEVEGAGFAESRVRVQAKLNDPFKTNAFGRKIRHRYMLVWSVQIV